VLPANGGARGDVRAVRASDVAGLASAEAREGGGCEREVFWNAFLVQASLGFR
jgi:hypothetical protein